MKKATQRLYQMDDRLSSDIRVEEEELFQVDLLNAYGKTFADSLEMASFFKPENEEKKRSLGHPCTGPIEIVTSRTEGSLQITLHDISITRAYQCLSKSSGLLPAQDQRFCEIFETCDQLSFQNGTIHMPVNPSLGFIGTFDETPISCGRASKNGGNIDLNYLRKGAIITLPIDKSARFAVGDLHLLQGNGEASGTGIEADGQVILSVKVVDRIPFPVIEQGEIVCIVGWGETLEACLKQGLLNSLFYLQHRPRLQRCLQADLYKWISATADMVIGNATGKTKTCGFVFKKNALLDAQGVPLL